MSESKGVVISLCDLTGNMVRPWAAAGWNCFAVDIQHSIRSPRVEQVGEGSITYEWGDVRSWTPPRNRQIDILFAFPPCTDLAASGARDYQTKRGYRLSDALELFDACQLAGEYSRSPYMIENPIGRLNTHRRKPDYMFDPCDYVGYIDGEDAYTKKTCLWVGGGFVMPPKRHVDPTEGSRMHTMGETKKRAAMRSATPMGFAVAVFSANSNLVGSRCERVS